MLREHFTTYAMDRRGFGASTDAVGYTIYRDARAIPDAEIRELIGHGHFAHRTDPHMVSTLIREFVAR